MRQVLCALGISLFPIAASAFEGPISYLEKFDCQIVEKCDDQLICRTVNEETEVIVTQVVSMAPWTSENHNSPGARITGVETIAWIDFLRYSKVPIPLPYWYEATTESTFAEPDMFSLKDWLSDVQISPYDDHEFAFVSLPRLEEKEWRFKVYEKLPDNNMQFKTTTVLCQLAGN